MPRIYKQIPHIAEDVCPICRQKMLESRSTRVAFYKRGNNKSIVQTITLVYCSQCDVCYANKELFSHYYSKRNELRPIFFNPQKINSANELLKKVMSTPLIFNQNIKGNVAPIKQKDNAERVVRNATTEKSKQPQVTPQQFHFRTPSNNQSEQSTQSLSVRNIPVHISNTYNFNTGVCPICCSVMNRDRANIPVLYENGDFYRYYAEDILYCHKCKKGYIGQKTIEKLLQRINIVTSHYNIAKLENVRVCFNRDQKFLYYPTLDNNSAVFFPGYEYHPSTIEHDSELNLNAQSFLGAMGYTVKLPEYSRKIILAKAVKQYGKRKVTDHICFLISSRKNQFNGATKYANAIRIWQKDLNYVVSL